MRALLTGRPGPLLGIEAAAWAAYKRTVVQQKADLAGKDPPQELIDW